MKTPQEIGGRFVAELTRAVGALLETSASSRTSAAQVDGGYVATIAGADRSSGALTVHFGQPGAESLAKAVNTGSVDVDDQVVLDALRTLCAQALGVFTAPLTLASVTPADEPGAANQIMTVEIVVKGREVPLHVGLAGAIEILDPADPSQSGQSKTLDVILDIDLPIVVRFGRTELPLRTLTALGPGSVIDLGRSPDEPVDVLISNRVVARGEVVIVGGNYGVRVRDVVSPAERARSLEAELA